ncbi:hypothetical protein CSQ91_03985 [Janthinobacterium sp. BJB301]|nr:hypothetical protein NC77_27025 [Janthinobacterium lividum]PHV22260.1 hypothetical protein CSQ92_04095 [Janthinobacterium sp. BJB446]PHV50352.1 hypothetical protein CSQ91_03985 [Janthinobacterium sp. BJB301]
MDRTSKQTRIEDLMAHSLICLSGYHEGHVVLRWQNKLYGSPEIKYSIILTLQTDPQANDCASYRMLDDYGAEQYMKMLNIAMYQYSLRQSSLYFIVAPR